MVLSESGYNYRISLPSTTIAIYSQFIEIVLNTKGILPGVLHYLYSFCTMLQQQKAYI